MYSPLLFLAALALGGLVIAHVIGQREQPRGDKPHFPGLDIPLRDRRGLHRPGKERGRS